MYWPIGAPRSFAQQLPNHVAFVSNDGLESADIYSGEEKGTTAQDGDTDLDVDEQISERNKRVEGQAEERAGHGSESRQGASLNTAQNIAPETSEDGTFVGIRVARNGQLFATITETALSVWQTQPTALLASVIRSPQSLQSYGPNVNLLLRPDADIAVLHTSLGYLITYSIAVHQEYRAYALHYKDGDKRHARRRSLDQSSAFAPTAQTSLLDGDGFVPDVSLRFSMVIKFDAGISRALALDHELIVATKKPAAIQCIRWTPDRDGSQTSTELLSRMEWLRPGSTLKEIVYDKPMNLYALIMDDGHAYAVQRLRHGAKDSKDHKALFKGHCFHWATSNDEFGAIAAIDSRFSLVAVGCADGSICLYSIRDYTGGISLLRRLPPPASASALTTLTYSPDGYCLFAGYVKGWATYSVFGQPGGASFVSNTLLTQQTGDEWLTGALDAFWIGGGSEIVMLDSITHQLWILQFARSAATGCFTPANVSKALLQTSTDFIVYRGHQMPDLLTTAADVSQWQYVKAPASYVTDQWPLRAVVVSPDGRYLALAGQRGLAHYSFTSARWKTFEDRAEQEAFFVRGGMCWHHHILIAATESTDSHELRLYSREAPLVSARTLHVQRLNAPVVHLSPSGDDSILVYTYDNVLDHYIVAASKKAVTLIKVGQIALNGIIRAPSRVRSVSWVVPDHQLQSGDPAQDVAVASVFFLVDGKLVLLQPSISDAGGLKYDMRMVAQSVEWYTLARDSRASTVSTSGNRSSTDFADRSTGNRAHDYSLGDSLWVYDGQAVKIWPSVNDLVSRISHDASRDIQAPISIPVDFYPLTALLQGGILFGVEAELLQRRDTSFSLFRAVARTSLYLPKVLEHFLEQFDSPGALHLSHHYHSLPYFSHALEILLHNVLDEEVENPPDPDTALLPAVLSFLSTFPEYLDIIVQCARKTELRSWRTLFGYLPPPIDLFEESLARGSLKTAGGYLLVLQNLEDASTSQQVLRLLRAAKLAGDWDLCKELARFLMALDESGDTLNEALELVNMASPALSRRQSRLIALKPPTNGALRLTIGTNTGLGITDR